MPSRERVPQWALGAAGLLLTVVLLGQIWGWSLAGSALLGCVAGGTNVWAFSRLVSQLLAGRAPGLYGSLLALKFIGLLAVLAGAVHWGWASPFPLAMGFLVATFVAPLALGRTSSLQADA